MQTRPQLVREDAHTIGYRQPQLLEHVRES